jgi:IMP dehydrogenase/GMP reductase
MEVVNKQHHLYKPDSECSPITLIMRKYYNNENSRGDRYERAKKAQCLKYATDEVYREEQKKKKRIYFAKKRAEKALLEPPVEVDNTPPVIKNSYEQYKQNQRERYANDEVYREEQKEKKRAYYQRKKALKALEALSLKPASE